MEDRFIIKINKINGTVEYENPDELNSYEVLGAIEVVKMLIVQNFIEGDD